LKHPFSILCTKHPGHLDTAGKGIYKGEAREREDSFLDFHVNYRVSSLYDAISGSGWGDSSDGTWFTLLVLWSSMALCWTVLWGIHRRSGINRVGWRPGTISRPGPIRWRSKLLSNDFWLVFCVINYDDDEIISRSSKGQGEGRIEVRNEVTGQYLTFSLTKREWTPEIIPFYD
jgi:hypothetical protein